MPHDGLKPTKLPTPVRVAVAVLVGGLVVAWIGIVGIPSLMLSRTPPVSEYEVAIDGPARELAGDLVFTMTDSQINDLVTRSGSKLVKLQRETEQITALVVVVVVDPRSEPAAEGCYELTVRPDDNNEATQTDQAACSVAPSR